MHIYGAFCTYCIFYLSNLNATSHVFLKEKRVLMFINYNPYQNIFQMTLKFLPCSWWYSAVYAFCTYCVFTLSSYFFNKNPFLKLFFKNRFYHLIEHTSKYLFMQKMTKRSHTAFLLCGAELKNHSYKVENYLAKMKKKKNPCSFHSTDKLRYVGDTLSSIQSSTWSSRCNRWRFCISSWRNRG